MLQPKHSCFSRATLKAAGDDKASQCTCETTNYTWQCSWKHHHQGTHLPLPLHCCLALPGMKSCLLDSPPYSDQGPEGLELSLLRCESWTTANERSIWNHVAFQISAYGDMIEGCGNDDGLFSTSGCHLVCEPVVPLGWREVCTHLLTSITCKFVGWILVNHYGTSYGYTKATHT